MTSRTAGTQPSPGLEGLSAERRALLAKLLRESRESPEKVDVESGLPAVTADPASRNEPFPLNDIQQAYWIGRSEAFELGKVGSHSYIEIDLDDVDLPRLQAAFQALVLRHEMLRAIVLPDGQQRFMQDPAPYEIEVTDLRGLEPRNAEASLTDIRARLSNQSFDPGRWPLFDIQATRMDARRTRLHLCFDMLIVDGWSLYLVLSEWAALYRDPQADLPTIDLSYRDYIEAVRKLPETEGYRDSKEYWLERVPSLPPAPDLPLAKRPSEIERAVFVRRTDTLDQETWSAFKDRAAQAGLTPTSALVGAFAQVLAAFSASPSFSINLPRFDRLPIHEDVNAVVGEMSSFTLLEIEARASESFADGVRRLHQRLWEDLDHRYFNGVEVLRERAKAQGGQGSSMPVVFTNAPKDPAGGDASVATAARKLGNFVYAINHTSQVWLDNHVSEEDGALACNWDCVEELFPQGLPDDMFAGFMSLLRRLAQDDSAWRLTHAEMSALLLPAGQQEQRAALRANEAPVPDVLLQDLFVEQAQARPEATALVAGGRRMTYAELLELSTRWGHTLRQLGASPNTPVAIVMEKGWEQIAGAMGVLMSGAACLPIDPYVPAERLRYLLDNSGAGIILTQSWLEASMQWPEGPRRLSVDTEDVSATEATPLDPASTPDDLAYVIYTSGSTGLPKGVTIAHRGIVNAILQTQERFGVGPDDRVLAVTALHHDMSMFDIYGTLAAGGTLVMPTPEGRRGPAHWSELMLREGVTIWNSVPAMMEMLLEFGEGRDEVIPDSLRLAFLGGDWIPLNIPDGLASHAASAQVVSVGGPTETTLWNIWYPVESVDPDWKSIPYGKPIANTRYYVMSGDLVERPTWVPGELCVAGVGVAKGYWNDPDRTNEKFVLHPATGERLCRTGDVGRMLPDGNIEFLGRKDFQVKIQGQRIELGEIEGTLIEHPTVRAAVASAVGQRQGKKRLVAYVVPAADGAFDSEALRVFASERLLEYMVPSAFVALDQLPLTPNGKVDRQALPDPSEEAVAAADAPASGTLSTMAEIVGEVLSLDQPDVNANLLSLGANSLDMVRIGNQMERRLGSRPRMDEIFRLQTIAALAGYYAEPAADDGSKAQSGPLSEIDALLASYRVLLDPAERDAFKKSRAGLRKDLDGRESVSLGPLGEGEGLLQRFQRRKSHRQFSLKPVPLAIMTELLGSMASVDIDGVAKYLYASPGGLNPTQVYLHIKPGRVEGVRGGVHYYDPKDHRLVCISPDVEMDRSLHIPFINTPIFDEAAFSLFLIADLDAIGPSYGDRSMHFVTLEVGIMTHQLEMASVECGIGLCQIGTVEFDQVRDLFDLKKSHIAVHCLLGGLPVSEGESPPPEGGGNDDLSKASRLLERVKSLSPEQAKALLEARKEA